MEKKELEKVFSYLNVIDLGSHFLYDDLELYDKSAGKSKQFKSVDEVLGNKEIHKKLDNITFNYLNGGRGASSGKMGGGFTSSNEGGADKSKSAHPAEFNNGGRFHNTETSVQTFIKKYGSANKEYGISIDEQGFAHKYVKGNAHSVSIVAAGKNHTIIHNHPSGGNFSKADLITTASGKNNKGIVATNSKKAYRFEKTKNFDSKGFTKAVNEAKWPKKYDYDKGADWWLKKNAKKYGYKYSYE